MWVGTGAGARRRAWCGVGVVRSAVLLCAVGAAFGVRLTQRSELAFSQAIPEQDLQSRHDLVDIALHVGVTLAGNGDRGDGHAVASFADERVQYDRREQIRVLGAAFVL